MKPKTAKPGAALPPVPVSAYPPDAVPLTPPGPPLSGGGGVVGDEYWGKGGSYIVVDGKRVPAPAEPQPEPATEKGN